MSLTPVELIIVVSLIWGAWGALASTIVARVRGIGDPSRLPIWVNVLCMGPVFVCGLVAEWALATAWEPRHTKRKTYR